MATTSQIKQKKKEISSFYALEKYSTTNIVVFFTNSTPKTDFGVDF